MIQSKNSLFLLFRLKEILPIFSILLTGCSACSLYYLHEVLSYTFFTLFLFCMRNISIYKQKALSSFRCNTHWLPEELLNVVV